LEGSQGRVGAAKGATTDPNGNTISVTSYTSGQVGEVQRSTTVGGTTYTESYLYSYLSSPDPNAGKVSSVVERRKFGSGSWTTVRQVQYAYYGSSESHGNKGDLKTATIQDGSGKGDESIQGVARGILGGKPEHAARDATALVIAAMGDHLGGKTAEARAALKDARARIEANMPKVERGQLLGDDWHDWLRCQILLREAEKLVEKDGKDGE
jgi:hypothetical protein